MFRGEISVTLQLSSKKIWQNVNFYMYMNIQFILLFNFSVYLNIFIIKSCGKKLGYEKCLILQKSDFAKQLLMNTGTSDLNVHSFLYI